VSVIDLADDQTRYDAIASGLIWSAPQGAQDQACQDIASGAVPMPSYLPAQARARIAEIKGTTDAPVPANAETQQGPV
jgi:hypothetical protein